jgi:hypothetical protein
MPMRSTKKMSSTLEKIEVKGIPSQYTEGSWSSASAKLRWAFRSTAVTVWEERSALAVGHQLVADVLEATPPSERWNVSTELVTSYRNVVEIRLSIELAEGTAAEMERAVALLHEITGQVK